MRVDRSEAMSSSATTTTTTMVVVGKGGKSPQLNRNKPKVRHGGKPICFKFNNRDETCTGECAMLHICQICLSPDHARYECTQ